MTRDEAIVYIAIEEAYIEDIPGSDNTVKALEMAIEALKQPERKKGRWVSYLKEGLKWKCSECGSRFTTPFHYCPHCAAEMEEVQ